MGTAPFPPLATTKTNRVNRLQKEGRMIVNHNTRKIEAYVGAMVLAAVVSSGYATWASHATHPSYALAILALSIVTSRMKVKLPGINGNMSVNMPFLLLAVVNLSAAEALAVACASTIVQTWPKREAKFKPQQMVFNVSMMAFATSVASLIWHAGWMGKTAWASEPLMLGSATATFFLGQTAPVAGVIKLTEGAAVRRIWMSIAQLSFPYYIVSAGMTSMVNTVSHHAGWQLALAVFPVMYGIYRSYKLYFESGNGVAALSLRAKAASSGA
jgi:hypothetical protein